MNPNDPTQNGDSVPAADPNAPIAPATDTPAEPMMPPAPSGDEPTTEAPVVETPAETPTPMGGDTTGTSEQPGGENPAGGTPAI